ncbi:hypothetical protein BDK51DRAFT_49561, partial [Blyttiomyces helicus]
MDPSAAMDPEGKRAFQRLDEDNIQASAPLNAGPQRRAKAKAKKIEIDEHLLTLTDLATRHHTTIDPRKPSASNGLRPGEATERAAVHGPNILTPPKRKHWTLIFLECLGNLFNVLLIIAGGGTYILFFMDEVNNFANSYIGAILVGVAFVNAFIEFYQLQKSAAILMSFM